MFNRMFRRKRRYQPPSRRRFGERLVRGIVRLAKTAAVLGAVALAGWVAWNLHAFLYKSDYFRLEDILIRGTEIRIEHQLRRRLRLAGSAEGNLIALDPEAARDTIEAHPRVRSARVEKVYPGLLIIDVEPRETVALLSGNPILGVDREGYVVERLSARHPAAVRHPFLSGIETRRLRPGDRIQSQHLTKMLQLVLSLKTRSPVLYGKASELHCDPEGSLTLLIKGGTELRFGPSDPIRKMPVLETFIERMGSLEDYAYVDLRFNGPVHSMTKQEARRQRAIRQISQHP